MDTCRLVIEKLKDSVNVQQVHKNQRGLWDIFFTKDDVESNILSNFMKEFIFEYLLETWLVDVANMPISMSTATTKISSNHFLKH